MSRCPYVESISNGIFQMPTYQCELTMKKYKHDDPQYDICWSDKHLDYPYEDCPYYRKEKGYR